MIPITKNFILHDSLTINKQIKKNPAFQLLQARKDVLSAEKKAIGYERKPRLGLGLDYAIVSARADANPENNGRNILMPHLAVTVPVFSKKQP